MDEFDVLREAARGADRNREEVINAKPTFISTFSGIGNFDKGLEEAGWTCVGQVEQDPECLSVLKRHFPGVPRFNDIRKVTGDDLGYADLLVGGFPCQDISVAGRRAGLAGDRSGLFFEFMRLVDEVRPRWILLENVHGLLSAGCKPKCEGGCIATHGGAMGTIIGALAKRGYGYAWRLLDAQHYGVAQRRKRIFIVGHLGESGGSRPWSTAPEVLFEPESLLGNPPPRPASRTNATPVTEGGTDPDGAGVQHQRDRAEGVVAALSSNGVGVSGPDDNQAQAGHLIADVPDVANTLGGGSGRRGWADDLDRCGAYVAYPPDVGRTLVAAENGPRYDFETETLVYEEDHHMVSGASDPILSKELSFPLTARNGDVTCLNQTFRKVHRANTPDDYESWAETDTSNTLNVFDESTAVRSTHAIVEPIGLVRRLTPVECERLQGSADGWTEWGLNEDDTKRKIADSSRYRMMGNSGAVPVLRKIGERMFALNEGKDPNAG